MSTRRPNLTRRKVRGLSMLLEDYGESIDSRYRAGNQAKNLYVTRPANERADAREAIRYLRAVIAWHQSHTKPNDE